VRMRPYNAGMDCSGTESRHGTPISREIQND
jgi:hypothetical protein